MIPIMLDPAQVRIAIIGKGELAARRLGQLIEGGALHLTIFSTDPVAELAGLAGDRLIRRLPETEELGLFSVIWIVDVHPATAERLARAARAAGALVNVEDVKDLCDFHSPSIVRRGDLLMTVSTAGRSPGLAARIRRHLEQTFGPEWGDRLDRLAGQRDDWRAEGKALPEVARLTEGFIDREGWLP